MNRAAIRRYGAAWLVIAVGLALVGAANWHLVHVATSSQPACVAHLRSGEGDPARARYSAAQSSCTPR
ncbi:hypothetical protein [Reyranella sp.]|uniref:hypothetical protein n=1 Tax=Reyranella sp. TaxID=1929291 RepID=UPI003D0B794F